MFLQGLIILIHNYSSYVLNSECSLQSEHISVSSNHLGAPQQLLNSSIMYLKVLEVAKCDFKYTNYTYFVHFIAHYVKF